ncbi:YfhH family protein [Shouchella shacheensis]|uniref:YfhH family protein n=1 Tax=Shouchella shacheensis TaxID=1649580 RepID=UPI000A75560E|nr:YfhH family protein [Shouchella shacheensis]
MERRFSEMSEYELRQEIATLNEKAKKAEQLGMGNEFAVHERRKILAQAYLLDPDQFVPGHTYRLTEGMDLFTISYMNGRFAWGHRGKEKDLSAVPISLLGDKVTE